MLDEAGNLWVTDFGLAKFETAAGLTMSGDLLGTLRYMAPEQALARHGLVDHRADVYSLGATLYELLTAAAGGRTARTRRRSCGTDRVRGAVAAAEAGQGDPGGAGDDRAQVPGEGPGRAVRHGRRVGRRPAAVADAPDDPGQAADGAAGTAKWARRHRPAVWAAAVCAATAIVALAGSVGWVARERADRQADAERRADEFLRESARLYDQGQWPECWPRHGRRRPLWTPAGPAGTCSNGRIKWSPIWS